MSSTLLSTPVQVVMDGTQQLLYTVASAHTVIPITITLHNVSTDNTTPTVSVWLVPTTGSPDNSNRIWYKTVLKGETVFINPGMYLSAGMKIYAQSTVAAKCNIQISTVDMF